MTRGTQLCNRVSNDARNFYIPVWARSFVLRHMSVTSKDRRVTTNMEAACLFFSNKLLRAPGSWLSGVMQHCGFDPPQGSYAPQGSTSLLSKLSVTSKVGARTSCAWVGSRVRFRSSEDVTLLEFTSPVDHEYMHRCQKFH